MTAMFFMNALKSFLQRELADVELQSDNLDKIEYVHPNIELMYLPHKNFLPTDYNAPFILICLDSGEENSSNHTVNVRLVLCTYAGGYYDNDQQNNTQVPDSKGYVDMLNLIERVTQKLIATRVIDGKGSINLPMNYGFYDTEQSTFPYWYGYITFSAELPISEYMMI